MTNTEAMPIDSAPKDGTPVYVWSMLGEHEFRWRKAYYDNGWRQCWRTLPAGLRLRPTHWMPLPPPPTAIAEDA